MNTVDKKRAQKTQTHKNFIKKRQNKIKGQKRRRKKLANLKATHLLQLITQNAEKPNIWRLGLTKH